MVKLVSISLTIVLSAKPAVGVTCNSYFETTKRQYCVLMHSVSGSKTGSILSVINCFLN